MVAAYGQNVWVIMAELYCHRVAHAAIIYVAFEDMDATYGAYVAAGQLLLIIRIILI